MVANNAAKAPTGRRPVDELDGPCGLPAPGDSSTVPADLLGSLRPTPDDGFELIGRSVRAAADGVTR